MAGFPVAGLPGCPSSDIVLKQLDARCGAMPDVAVLGRRVLARLEILHGDICRRGEEDEARVAFANCLVQLVKITRRKPLLVRLANYDAFAQRIFNVHLVVDGIATKGNPDDYEILNKWRDDWEYTQTDQFDSLERSISIASDRKLMREMRSERNLEIALIQIKQQSENETLTEQQQTLFKVALDRVKRFARIKEVEVLEWFVSVNSLDVNDDMAAVSTFGQTHQAMWYHDGQTERVVIKKLVSEIVMAARDPFSRDLQAWLDLPPHPNILKLLGGCHIGSELVYVCEDAPQGNLIEFFRDEQDMELFWKIFVQVAEGLQVLHRHQLVHGALTCCNILVVEDNIAKLTDFGFASVRTLAATQNTEAAKAAGDSIRWKAKEVLDGVEEPIVESDIYSLGMCMLQVLSHRPPFATKDTKAAMEMIMEGKMPDRQEYCAVSDDMWKLITRLCDPDYTKRPSLSVVIKSFRGKLARSTSNMTTASSIEDNFTPGSSVMTEVFQSEKTDGSILTKTVKSSSHPTTTASGMFVQPIEVETMVEIVDTAVEETDVTVETDVMVEEAEMTEGHKPQHPPSKNHRKPMHNPTKNTTKEITEVTEVAEATEMIKDVRPPTMEEATEGAGVSTAEKNSIFRSSCSSVWYDGDQWCRNCGKLLEDESRHSFFGFNATQNRKRIDIWKKLYEIAKALQDLHHDGIVHGDVKPCNFRIGRDGQAHLAGFDYSFRADRDQDRGRQADRLRWQAPECLSGSLASFKSDVYSFGMCAIFALSGKPPFGALLADSEVISSVLESSEIPPRPNGFADQEWELIERMCCHNVNSRLGMDAVVNELAEFFARGTDHSPEWSILRNDITYSGIPFSVTSLALRYRGLWKDAVVTVEEVASFDYNTQGFQNVVALWYSLRYPTVLQLFGAYEKDYRRLFISEHAQHGDLGVYINVNGADPADVGIWQILLDTALAIQYLHANDIVHGDIALYNILVGAGRRGRLTGFYSSNKESQPQSRSPPPVLEPEGEPEPGDGMSLPAHASHCLGYSDDIYRLGRCILQAFSGTLLKLNSDCHECQRSNKEFSRPEGFSEEEWNLVSAMCCSSPSKRIQAAEVVFRLERLVAASEAIQSKTIEGGICLSASEQKVAQAMILERMIAIEQEEEQESSADDDQSDDEFEFDEAPTQRQNASKETTVLEYAMEAAEKVFTSEFKAELRGLDTSYGPHFGVLKTHSISSAEPQRSGWRLSARDIRQKSFSDLGGGAFGNVFRGTWLGSLVAIKTLKVTDSTEDSKMMKNLILNQAMHEEINIWFGLRHPNIATLYGVCFDGRQFVCELLDGEGDKFSRSLDQRSKIEKDKVKIWGYLHDAAVGLQGLHMQNVVHADLKCDNILIDVDGRAKLIDFGLSCLRTCDGGKPVGAFRWKAPECLKGAGPTFESDVYSFGMCIVEAVSGTYPWGTKLDVIIEQQVKKGKLPPRPVRFEEKEWEIVTRMCCETPSDRLDLDLVVKALGSFAERLPYAGDLDLEEKKGDHFFEKKLSSAGEGRASPGERVLPVDVPLDQGNIAAPTATSTCVDPHCCVIL